MKFRYLTGFAGMLLTATMCVPPVAALDLLGVVTLNEADDSGVVDVDLGGNNGQVLSADVLSAGGGSAVSANASAGGSGGILDADVGLLQNSVTVDANIGGPDRLVGVGIGIGNGNGTDGNNGDIGAGGNSGGNRTAANSGSAVTAACVGVDPNQALRLYEGTSISGWQRASNIEIAPLRLCPGDRQRVSEILMDQQGYDRLLDAVQGDPLIAAALSRSTYSAERVLGVNRSGAKLTVYVY